MAAEGWQMGFKSIDQACWTSEVECNPKMSISFFMAGEGWQMGFESIDQPGQSSEVEGNPKTSISFFWLERGDRWGLSPSTSPANRQKLNIILEWAFNFFGWRGVADGVWVHRPARPIIRSWTYSKNEDFIFLAGEGWQMGFESINQPGRSSEVEHIPKMSIEFFWLEMRGRCCSSPWTNLAYHQNLNVM